VAICAAGYAAAGPGGLPPGRRGDRGDNHCGPRDPNWRRSRRPPGSPGSRPGPLFPFGFTGPLVAPQGSLWLATEQGTYRLNPVTLAPSARVIAAGQSLLDTGDTGQVLIAGGSAYVSYSGGLARYPASPTP
jgi:hypothetical protein